MSIGLSYILITPYTIVKSRTGGVISRLLSRLDLELIGAQIITPSAELANEFAESMLLAKNNTEWPNSSKILHDYILRTFSPSGGRRHRVLMLLFKGEDAIQKLTYIAGSLYPKAVNFDLIRGETIRDTYADLILKDDDPGEVLYFEPAVFTPHSEETALHNLELFGKFAANEPNIVENVKYENPSSIERTLVIIKPDNWRFPSSKPGTIMDMFSKTGLRIVGCKIYQMSVSEALEFYGGVRKALNEKLSPIAGKMAADILGEKYDMEISSDTLKGLTESFGMAYADDQFSKIIEFMSGVRPEQADPNDFDKPGKVKCMVLIYEGENAVEKIRKVLGPTDPTKAPGGTVRREFGSDIMINTAHASDSAQSAVREMAIVNIRKNNLSEIIFEYLKEIKMKN